MRLRSTWQLLRDAAFAWNDDRASSLGAALSFYTLFSLAPLLLLVISISGLLFDEARIQSELIAELGTLLGDESARTIGEALNHMNRSPRSVPGAIAGLVVILFGATSVLSELQQSMDRIWQVPGPPGSDSPASASLAGVLTWLRRRLVSLGMVLGIGFLLIVSLAASTALAALGKLWSGWLATLFPLTFLLEMGVSFVLLSSLFAMIYRWLPRQQIAWEDVGIGAVFTALLFTLGKGLIGLYIGRSGVVSAYGAAASLVAILLWVYYSAQIFLYGAELTWVYAHRHGSLAGTADPAREPKTWQK